MKNLDLDMETNPHKFSQWIQCLFLGELLIDARPAAHRDVPRDLTWSTDDIATGVDNGELIVLDPRERVIEHMRPTINSLCF